MVCGGIEDDVGHGRSQADHRHESDNKSGAYGFTPTALQVLTRLPTIIGKTLHSDICIRVIAQYTGQNYKEKLIYPTGVVIFKEKDGALQGREEAACVFGKGVEWFALSFGYLSAILRVSFGYPSRMTVLAIKN